MIKASFEPQRHLRTESLSAELVIVGGGIAGTCCAITAAREGIRVVLVQDRPVLGGNSSSEVRLWILGATSHMGNNNRWAREGGVIDEILVENTYRNPEGNPLILDTILLEKVIEESNVTLLLNTAVYEVEKKGDDTIRRITAFCSQNSMRYQLSAPLFCDASGDGIVGFLAGAAFRMGAEAQEEFGEKFAPTEAYGELLGHTLYFYSKDTGQPVRYVAPSYAIDIQEKVPRYKSIGLDDYGCRLWWIEWGGRLDTVHETETIKWELWKVVYGIWDHIKNSGEFPDAENLTLEWVGTIPGKRESRRFEGDYMLTQHDVVEQRLQDDAVAFGGWAIDLHPADGVFSEKPGCNQWHTKGVYQIPYRCLYSKNIKNLFLSGRIISASHVAFGSSRVMATCGHAAQAVGVAAALCAQQGHQPADLQKGAPLRTLQQRLLARGQHIPQLHLEDQNDLVWSAQLTPSSELVLTELPPDGPWLSLEYPAAQMLPVPDERELTLTVWLHAQEATTLTVELRSSSKLGNHTPDVTLEKQTLWLKPGEQEVTIAFSSTVAQAQYVFVCFMRNEQVQIQGSERRITGILSVFNKFNKAVSNHGKQAPEQDIGMEAFEFWCPARRPGGHNLAMCLRPGLSVFGAENLRSGVMRPTHLPNAWVADPEDSNPRLTLRWHEPQSLRHVVLHWDTDFDHPMESALMGHPESVMPFCVQHYRLQDDQGRVVYEQRDNHQSRNELTWDTPVVTRQLTIILYHPSPHTPAALLGVRCYQ